MAMNPSISYVQNGETFSQTVFNRPVVDLISNLRRIDALREELFSGFPASVVVSGVFDSIRIPYATETTYGGVLKAREVDMLSGTDDTRYVTPERLKYRADEAATLSGVSLQGEPLITAGIDEDYVITNYDSFSVYSVSATVGSVTLVGDTITLDTAPEDSGSTVITVTKNGKDYQYQISIGAASVSTPSINQPVDFPPEGGTLSASSFSTIPSGLDTHASTDWQLSKASNFSVIETQSMGDTVNLTSWTVPITLDAGDTYYARVRYHADSIGTSAWSPTRTFTVLNTADIPSIISPGNGETEVQETPQIVSSAFNSVTAESHSYSDWVIRNNSTSSVVYEVNASSSNKTTLSVPAGILEENTTYNVAVRYYGSVTGYTPWSNLVVFTTQEEFFVFEPSNAGESFGGGYYSGGNVIIDGNLYAIIVAPRTQGGVNTSTLAWSTNSSVTATDVSNSKRNDGYANQEYFKSTYGNLDDFPAMKFCDDLSINGMTDWYLPSKDEMEVCYRYLKPTTESNDTVSGANPSVIPATGNYTKSNPSRTSLPSFHSSGSEALYITSTGRGFWGSSLQSTTEADRQVFSERKNTTYKAGRQAESGGGIEISDNGYYGCFAVRRHLIGPV